MNGVIALVEVQILQVPCVVRHFSVQVGTVTRGYALQTWTDCGPRILYCCIMYAYAEFWSEFAYWRKVLGSAHLWLVALFVSQETVSKHAIVIT